MVGSRDISRRGFTLIELVMIIIILAIVAGTVSLLLGRLPSTATASTSAGTVSQAARAILQFRTFENRFPDRLDLLLADHTSDVLPASLSPDLDGDGIVVDQDGSDDDLINTGELQVFSLDGVDGLAIRDTLVASGITQVVESPDNLLDDQTNFIDPPDGSSQSRLVSELENLVVLGPQAITRLGLDPGTEAEADIRYVVFGLGNRCEMVGEAILNAPIHTRQESGAVTQRYARYLPVFRVQGNVVSLAAVAALENEDGVATVVGVDEFLQVFYRNRNLSS